MKTTIKFLVVLGVLAVIPGFTAQAQSSQPRKHRELTVWVQNQRGSFIGSGYASTYLTNIRARTLGKEDPNLRNSINALDGLGMLPVQGFGLLPAAVAWQTGTSMRTLIEQQAETGLSYGELLIANSLAAKSKQDFDTVMAMREKTRTWGELAEQLHVSPDLIISRANTAAKRIVDAEFLSDRRKQHAQDPSVTSINPHIQRSAHY
jgi:hypothetical protein